MAEFGAGTRPRSSASRFRFTRFLYEICCRKRKTSIPYIIFPKSFDTHLQNQVTQLLLLLCNPFATLFVLLLQLQTLTHRIGGQANPPDLLFLLGYNVHGHQHVQGVVDATSNVFLVVCSGGAGVAGDFLNEQEVVG
jgi:hypothetical protein